MRRGHDPRVRDARIRLARRQGRPGRAGTNASWRARAGRPRPCAPRGQGLSGKIAETTGMLPVVSRITFASWRMASWPLVKEQRLHTGDHLIAPAGRHTTKSIGRFYPSCSGELQSGTAHPRINRPHQCVRSSRQCNLSAPRPATAITERSEIPEGLKDVKPLHPVSLPLSSWS